MEEYETVLLVKPEVFVYNIPPRSTNRGYRAADWKLDVPDWTGRMRVVSKGKSCFIKLEDKNSGELFAKSPIDKYPGIAVESVSDSSRYFVLRIENENGRAAFIGIGFADRGDSFDLNVALQEHFKWLQKSEEFEQEAGDSENKSNLDLGFKEGQTITINMNIGSKAGSSKPRPKTSGAIGGTPGLLPPPPGGIKLPPPSAKLASHDRLQQPPKSHSTQNGSSNLASANDLLLDLESPSVGSSGQDQPVPSQSSGTELWGDFTTATKSSSVQPSSAAGSDSWISF